MFKEILLLAACFLIFADAQRFSRLFRDDDDSYQNFNSGIDIEKRGDDTPICRVEKVKKGEDHKLDVTPAHFRLDGHSYPFDPEVYQKGKIKCILNVPALNNSVKCEMDEIRSYDVVAIGGCTAMHFK